jgi:uncharacterized protein
MDNTPAGQASKDDAAQVAAQAIDALWTDKHAVVTGSLKTRLQGNFAKLLPNPARAAMHMKQTRPLDYEAESRTSGMSSAAVGGMFFVGALAAVGTAAWLQSRRDEEDVERRTKRRLEPHADFEVAGRPNMNA